MCGLWVCVCVGESLVDSTMLAIEREEQLSATNTYHSFGTATNERVEHNFFLALSFYENISSLKNRAVLLTCNGKRQSNKDVKYCFLFAHCRYRHPPHILLANVLCSKCVMLNGAPICTNIHRGWNFSPKFSQTDKSSV